MRCTLGHVLLLFFLPDFGWFLDTLGFLCWILLFYVFCYFSMHSSLLVLLRVVYCFYFDNNMDRSKFDTYCLFVCLLLSSHKIFSNTIYDVTICILNT